MPDRKSIFSLNKKAGLLKIFRKPAFSFYLCTNKIEYKLLNT